MKNNQTMSDDKKVIFSMQKLSKTYSSSDKQVLKKHLPELLLTGLKFGILGLKRFRKIHRF